MTIGWFPGHMAAARKKVAEAMAEIDAVVEVLDARLPAASSNPMLTDLRTHRQRPALKILNKSDLADPEVTAQWMRMFEEEASRARTGTVKAVALSCSKPADVARVTRLAGALVPHRGGLEKPVRLLVIGIPNVGKSTLINGLIKRRIANVGDEPAVTKRVQRYNLPDRTVLYDTPGLMWPAIRHAGDGLMLAASHAIGPNAYIDEEVATFLGDILLARYPALVAKRYNCDPEGMDGTALIEAVAKQRGFRIKGGGFDFDKAAVALLTDYRNGALGRISLETPATRAAMLAAPARAAAVRPAPVEEGE